jgi:hypothetical protein
MSCVRKYSRTPGVSFGASGSSKLFSSSSSSWPSSCRLGSPTTGEGARGAEPPSCDFGAVLREAPPVPLGYFLSNASARL